MKRTCHKHHQASRSISNAVRCEPLEQRQLFAAPPLAATIESFNFDSIAVTSTFYATPPSSSVAVGPNHVVNVVRTGIQWYTKSGTLQSTQRLGKNNGGSATGSFFASLSPVSNVDRDAHVIYDQFSNRFVVLGLDNSIVQGNSAATTSRLLVAVSDDSDPNGTWYYKAIDAELNIGGVNHFAEWVGLSCDAQGVYVTSTMFNLNSISPFDTRIFAINKTPFYTGGAASVNVFGQYFQGGLPLPVTPVQTIDALPNMMLWAYTYHSVDGITFIQLMGVDNPLTSPAIGGFITVQVANDDVTTTALTAPQLGTATPLAASNFERLENAVYRDGFLWTCKTVTATVGPDAGTPTVHWYKFDPGAPFGTPPEWGSIGGEDIAPGTRTFFPSMMVDASGNMAMSFSASGPNIYPGAYYTTKFAGDPAGTTQPSRPLAAGTDSYVRDFGIGNLWGMRSSIALDPSVSNTVWMYNQYAMARGTAGAGGGDGRWATRNGKMVIAPPGAIAGTAYVDANLDDVYTSGVDVFLTGATMYLDANNNGALDAGEPSSVTGTFGEYAFAGLAAGTYKLRQVPQADLFPITAPRDVTVAQGLTTTINAANVRLIYGDFNITTNWTLRLNAAGTRYEILSYQNYQIPTNVPYLSFDLQGGNDTFTLDFVNGAPIPPGGVTVAGSNGSDTLFVAGSSASEAFAVSASAITRGGATISYSGMEAVNITGNGGTDSYAITSTAAGAPLSVTGSTGVDSASLLNLTAANYPAAITFNGGGGTTDELILNEPNSLGGGSIGVSPTQVTKGNGFAGLTYSNIERMRINDGTNSTEVVAFQVSGTAPGLQLEIDGGNMPDLYDIRETGANSFVSIVNSPGGDIITVNTDNIGTAVVRQAKTLLTPLGLGIGAGGTFQVGPGSGMVLRTPNFGMDPAGNLDLFSNSMIIDYDSTSPVADIAAKLASGYANGAWNGVGIRSSTAASTPGRTVGYAEASDVFSIFPAAFLGQLVDNTTVLVRYTLAGDANLYDGKVDVADLGMVASNWQQSPRRYSQGDFDYNGTVNVGDLGILASNWQQQLGAPGAPAAPATRRGDRLIDQITL